MLSVCYFCSSNLLVTIFDVKYLMVPFLFGACGVAELNNIHCLQYLNILYFFIKSLELIGWAISYVKKQPKFGFCYAA